MAFRYKVDAERKVALLTFTGSVSGDELATATRTIYEDPGWGFGFDAIWDFTRITELVLEWKELQGLIDIDREYADVAGPGRDLLVVSRSLDEVIGEAHAHLSKAGPRRSVVCRSLNEAWKTIAAGEPHDDRV